MSARYQETSDPNVWLRLADGRSIPHDLENGDYRVALDEVTADPSLLAATDPIPDPEPSRDTRILLAVEQAKVIVQSGGFTEEQATKLVAIFDGLGSAIAPAI